MVSAAISRQKTRQEGREEGQAVGREEANTAWREWNRRREEDAALGKPFDEPTADSGDVTYSPGARSCNRYETLAEQVTQYERKRLP